MSFGVCMHVTVGKVESIRYNNIVSSYHSCTHSCAFTLTYMYNEIAHTCIYTHSILPELQGVFGHLLESKLQYYSPENFWKKFKLWGQPVNVREQQDAFDFFCNLTDQVDEQLKVSDSRVCAGTRAGTL